MADEDFKAENRSARKTEWSMNVPVKPRGNVDGPVDRAPTTNESVLKQSSGVATGDDALLGKVVGQYQVVSSIGEGGMSRVFKARDLLLNKTCAIKFIHPSLVHDARSFQRFRQEAQAAISLSHPNICSVKNFYADDATMPFLVMDFMDGRSLERLLDEESMTMQRGIDLAVHVCRGLDHAHEKGVIHRDIKPANIIVELEKSGLEVAKIVDFGIAKIARDDDEGTNLTRTGDVFGTPNYMSPEQSLGRKVDHRTDIYAVGCVLYELVSGKPPFNSDSTLEVLMMHVNDPVPPIASTTVPVTLKEVIYRCLAKDPDKRYQKIRQLEEDLLAVREWKEPPNLSLAEPAKSTPFPWGVLLKTTPIIVALGAALYWGFSRNGDFVPWAIGIAAVVACWWVIAPYAVRRVKESDRKAAVKGKWRSRNQKFTAFMIAMGIIVAAVYVIQWTKVVLYMIGIGY